MINEPRFDADDEREWEAQERARVAERAGTLLDGDDASARRYRALARELGALPRVALPATFARAVARRVAIRVEPALAPFERALVSLLVAVFVVAAAIGAAAFGVSSPVVDAMRASAAIWNRWTLVLAACLVACAISARLRIPPAR